jgi:hypothetical protein
LRSLGGAEGSNTTVAVQGGAASSRFPTQQRTRAAARLSRVTCALDGASGTRDARNYRNNRVRSVGRASARRIPPRRIVLPTRHANLKPLPKVACVVASFAKNSIIPLTPPQTQC